MVEEEGPAMLSLKDLGKWLQPLCEKHRRTVLLQCGLNKATDTGVPLKNVSDMLENLGYTLSDGGDEWILL